LLERLEGFCKPLDAIEAVLEDVFSFFAMAVTLSINVKTKGFFAVCRRLNNSAIFKLDRRGAYKAFTCRDRP
jgi:hypothetical protein